MLFNTMLWFSFHCIRKQILIINKYRKMKSRKGIITISSEILEEANPEILKAIFSKIFPLQTIENEQFLNKKTTSYLALSEKFRELKEGDKIPDYQISLIQAQNLVISEISEIEQYQSSPVSKCISTLELIKIAKEANASFMDRLKVIANEDVPEGKIIVTSPLNFERF